MKRGSSGGTFSRAKCSLPVVGLRTITARFNDSPEMYGNGCAGSTASGVSTGKIIFRKYLCSRSFSLSCSASKCTSVMPSAASAGCTCSENTAACRAASSCALTEIISSTCRGSSPEAAVTAIPVAIRRFSPATRTMKNSSRLEAKIARNRTRSSSGRPVSSAISSTRSLNCNQLSSRSANRSSGRGWSSNSAAAPASGDGALPAVAVSAPEASSSLEAVPAGALAGLRASIPTESFMVLSWHPRLAGGTQPGVLHVDSRPLEAGAMVNSDRWGVLPLDVQLEAVQASLAEGVHRHPGQRRTQPAALSCGVHAEDVDLPDPRCLFGRLSSRALPGATVGPGDRSPHRGQQLAGGLIEGQPETGRVEPGLFDACLQIRQSSAALLGVIGKGPGIHLQPCLLIGADLEGADLHTGR